MIAVGAQLIRSTSPFKKVIPSQIGALSVLLQKADEKQTSTQMVAIVRTPFERLDNTVFSDNTRVVARGAMPAFKVADCFFRSLDSEG